MVERPMSYQCFTVMLARDQGLNIKWLFGGISGLRMINIMGEHAGNMEIRGFPGQGAVSK
jgi:hypothetical protein